MSEKLRTNVPIHNSKHRNMPESRRCVAHRKNGDRCQKPSILGATVCASHGGAAGHVKRAAKARLENAADRVARQLLGMAQDDNLPPAVKLAAIKDVLDRAGLGARAALDVTHELKPWEKVLEGVYRGPEVGAPAAPVGGTLDTEVIDGEVIEYAEFSDDNGSTP